MSTASRYDSAIRQRIASAAGRTATSIGTAAATGAGANIGALINPAPATSTATARPVSGQGFDAELSAFMQQIRTQESSGNYGILGPQTKYGRPRGAYQILDSNWSTWAAQAGVPGADWRDQAAQDRVARHKFTEYYQQYGSWEAVAVAWFAGPGRAAKYVDDPSSVINMQDVLGTSVGRYVQKAITGQSENLGYQAQQPATGLVYGPSQSWDARSVGDVGQQLANHFGLEITSHERGAAENARIGGAQNSDHLTGLGIDFGGDHEQMMSLARYLEPFTGPDGPLRLVLDPENQPHGTGPHVHVSFKTNSTASLTLPGDGDVFAPGGAIDIAVQQPAQGTPQDQAKRGAAGLVAAMRGSLGSLMDDYNPQGTVAPEPDDGRVETVFEARKAGLR